MKKHSIYTNLSFILTALLLCAVLTLSVTAPMITDMYIRDNCPQYLSSYPVILTSIYVVLAVALIAIIVLFRLLFVVKENRVFSDSTFQIMSALSMCCFAEVVAFSLLGMYFLLSFVLSFSSLFLGVLLLVVRYVIMQATEIKEENDFTV